MHFVHAYKQECLLVVRVSLSPCSPCVLVVRVSLFLFPKGDGAQRFLFFEKLRLSFVFLHTNVKHFSDTLLFTSSTALTL